MKRKADTNPLTGLINFPQHVMGGFTKLTGIQLLPASAKVSNVIGWPANRRIEHVPLPAHSTDHAPAHNSDSEPAPSEIYQDYLTAPLHGHNTHKEIHLATDNEPSSSSSVPSYEAAPLTSSAASGSLTVSSASSALNAATTPRIRSDQSSPAASKFHVAHRFPSAHISSGAPSSPVALSSSGAPSSPVAPSSLIALNSPVALSSGASSTSTAPSSTAVPSYPASKNNPRKYRLSPGSIYSSSSSTHRSYSRQPSSRHPGPRPSFPVTLKDPQQWNTNSLVRQDFPSRKEGLSSLFSLFHLPSFYPITEDPTYRPIRRNFASPPKPKPSPTVQPTLGGIKPVQAEVKPTINVDNANRLQNQILYYIPSPDLSKHAPVDIQSNFIETDQIKPKYIVDNPTKYEEPIKPKYIVDNPTKYEEPINPKYIVDNPTKYEEPIEIEYNDKNSKKPEEPMKTKFIDEFESTKLKFNPWTFEDPIKPTRFKPASFKTQEPIKSNFIDVIPGTFIDVIPGTFVYNEPDVDRSFDVLQARIDEKLQGIIDDIVDEVEILDGEESEINIEVNIAGDPEDYIVDLAGVEPGEGMEELRLQPEISEISGVFETTPGYDEEMSTKFMIEIESTESLNEIEDDQSYIGNDKNESTEDKKESTEVKNESTEYKNESTEYKNESTEDKNEIQSLDEENNIGAEFSFVIDYSEPDIEELKVRIFIGGCWREGERGLI